MTEEGEIRKIIIGCDHAAYRLKEKLKFFLKKCYAEVTDAGVYDMVPVDYPDIGLEVASQISNGIFKYGILMCGTGLGMSMVANRFRHVRAALCNDLLTAKMSKLHNNSNVLVMGARIISESMATNITKIWLETNFESGRHQRRLDKFDTMESEDLSNFNST